MNARALFAPPTWIKRLVLALCAIVIALGWINSRIFVMRRNQPGARPVVLSGYYIYHGMAIALREGRIGQFDMEARRQFLALNDPLAVYQRARADGPHEWVTYYTLDIGYLFIVEAARLAFQALPDNILRALALQFFVDAGVVLFLYFVFSQWGAGMGVLAALLYSTNAVFAVLASLAYYYYWDIPLTVFVLGALLFAWQRPQEARSWLTAAAFALGFGVWLRGSWWPLAFFFFSLVAARREFRYKLVAPLVVFVIVAAPQVIRSSAARGRLALSTRAAWHVALVGLGYYPNRYGLEANDGAIFQLTKEKYGVEYRLDDYYAHDQAAKKEFLKILREDPRFVVNSFFGRLKESLIGSTQTSILSYLFFSNSTYRLLCLIGLAAMIAYGGDLRLLGIAAGGMYAIYVVLTCVFYFVGLAYDNVSEVTMLVCFLGGIECVVRPLRGRVTRLAVRA